jgi:hypothetical protein
LPLAFHLTGGEASDSRNFEILLDIGPDITPRAVLGDKGYDAKANREAARRRGMGLSGISCAAERLNMIRPLPG